MEIDVENSAVGPESEGIPVSVLTTGDVVRTPRINTQLAQTTVSAASGQTIVMGGLIRTSRSQVHRRVPLLASVPILGHLFRYDAVISQRTELLIIMTPHVVRTESDAEWIKQVEAARMSWVLSDVCRLHGNAGLRTQFDNWGDGEIPVVHPDSNPSGAIELQPAPPVGPDGNVLPPEQVAPPEGYEVLPGPIRQQPLYPATPGLNTPNPSAPGGSPNPPPDPFLPQRPGQPPAQQAPAPLSPSAAGNGVMGNPGARANTSYRNPPQQNPPPQTAPARRLYPTPAKQPPNFRAAGAYNEQYPSGTGVSRLPMQPAFQYQPQVAAGPGPARRAAPNLTQVPTRPAGPVWPGRQPNPPPAGNPIQPVMYDPNTRQAGFVGAASPANRRPTNMATNAASSPSWPNRQAPAYQAQPQPGASRYSNQ